ncbi:hypothetical protein [Nocardioides sp. WS12]|uniref:hypothetical protein n=1 Tax=Nocardioides sp. WS12 TaxID=2486272 RepID=UPI0015FAE045|nr:hypothetical protein [Nocardioides sp. WS12]
MLTVRELADRFGTTVTFAVRALETIGHNAGGPESPVPDWALARFVDRFGEKIRAVRPKSSVVATFTAETDVAPVVARTARKDKPHVMRVAHSRVTGGRDGQGNRVKRLLDDPGPIHAIDAAGTWDGDPWNGEVLQGAVHFYSGGMNTGPPAACGVSVRAVLSDEFVPEEEPSADLIGIGRRAPAAFRRQCRHCATAVAEGQGFRTPPHERVERTYFCESFLRVRVDGTGEVQDCTLHDRHDGPHRTRDGATWTIGFDDFVPAPLDASRKISKAS